MEANEIDLTLALQLQARFNEERRVQSKSGKLSKTPDKEDDTKKKEKLSVSLVDPSWEYLDPTPDMRALFLTFNDQFFWGRLGGVEVKWSPRMTLCAGVCRYQGRAGYCSISLSTPLLKLRPRKDLVETLLHEMIHAYLFVTQNNRDRDGHGPEFHKHMYRINYVAGTMISVYHSFHDEVSVYRQHIWQCSGPCRSKPPYYGLVKRSMNRAPSPRDPWWPSHQAHCNGTYVKIKEPEGYGVKKNGKGQMSTKEPSKGGGDIRKYFSPSKDSENAKRPKLTNKLEDISNKAKTTNSDSKINGFSSISTGSVSSIGVKNASNSRVHGFSKGNDNSVKPKERSESVKSKEKGGSSKFKSGGGTLTKSKGGSNTVVIKKPKFHPDAAKEAKEQDRDKFLGTGHTLGSGSGRSRLLDLYSGKSNKECEKKKITPNEAVCEDLDSDCDFGAIDKCPLCQKEVAPSEFDQHIAECIGDFDYDDPMDDGACQIVEASNIDTVDNMSKNEEVIVLDDSFFRISKEKE